jgi:hypothetical protein
MASILLMAMFIGRAVSAERQVPSGEGAHSRPNIVLIMADDKY